MGTPVDHSMVARVVEMNGATPLDFPGQLRRQSDCDLQGQDRSGMSEWDS
jgi:hypothetical protein